MCESCNGADGMSRRALLAGVVGGAAGVLVARPALARPALPLQLPTVTVAPGLEIVTRDGWAQNRPPRGEIQVETDVRFLLVHHTAEPGNNWLSCRFRGSCCVGFDCSTGQRRTVTASIKECEGDEVVGFFEAVGHAGQDAELGVGGLDDRVRQLVFESGFDAGEVLADLA